MLIMNLFPETDLYLFILYSKKLPVLSCGRLFPKTICITFLGRSYVSFENIVSKISFCGLIFLLQNATRFAHYMAKFLSPGPKDNLVTVQVP